MTARCIMCREPIEAGAKICTHCNSYQGWWGRNLARGTLVIGAIAALLPLFSAASSLREIVLERHKADIHVRAASCQTDRIELAIANLGRGAGLIGDVILAVDGVSVGYVPGLELRHEPFEVVVKPLYMAVVTLKGYLHNAELTL